jgi:1-deoxy-D-xylulose-5-phosphate synthase
MIKKPEEYLFMTTGIAAQIALNASKKLDKEHNIKSGIIHFPSIKPLDSQAILKWVKKVKRIITVEENVLSGGFGSSILEFCNENLKEHVYKISRIGLKDEFLDDYGDQNSLLNKYAINQHTLCKKMLSLIKK